MLDILIKTIQIFGTNDIHSKSCNVYTCICELHTCAYTCNVRHIICIFISDGLLICLSESDLMQSMLLNYDLARSHMLFVRSNLRTSQIFVLQVRNLNI